MVGTFALCYVGGLSYGLLVNVALAYGFVLGFFVYAGANISGAHYNPAVTLALLVIGRVKPVNAIMYIIFQLIGGILAGMMSTWMWNDVPSPGNNGPHCPDGVHHNRNAWIGAVL